MKRTWRERQAAAQTLVRDRIEVELTPKLEEAVRAAGPLEPFATTKDGAPLYGVYISLGPGPRFAMLSSVPPLDDKEACPVCGSRNFDQWTIGFMPWCPDPNQRTCFDCKTKWKLCGNGLPVLQSGRA